MPPADTTSLLQEVREGSPSARETLYARVAAKLLPIIRLRMGQSLRARLESRDILQATLLKSVRHFDQFEGRDGAALIGWLVRIADNEIRDQADFQFRQRRDAAAAVPLDEAQEDIAARVRSALSQVVLDEEAERLERALEQLDATHRDVIVLRKLEELSFKAIATRLGRSEDACRMLFVRAMTALTLKLTGSP